MGQYFEDNIDRLESQSYIDRMLWIPMEMNIRNCCAKNFINLTQNLLSYGLETLQDLHIMFTVVFYLDKM